MASFPRAALFFLVLLVAPLCLCSSATTLDEEERQKEEEALESVNEAVRGCAADGAPEPPQNLVVFPQSPNSIMLTWHSPSNTTDLDHYVVYVEDEDLEDTTKEELYIFDNLEACKDYIFGVMSVSAAGDTSDPLLGEEQTDVGTPPAPQNLQVDGYTGTAVTLSWGKPDTLCDVEGYRVQWSTDDTNTQSTTTSETSFTVTELSKNTSYIFSVFASTSFGQGPEATVQQTTAMFDGGAPENLVAIGVSSSAINVSWSPAPGEVQYYVVTAIPCMLREDIVSGLSYLITGLDPCEKCDIFVTSHYSDTIEYEDSVTGTTDGGDPPPPESCSVQVEGSGLSVTWEKSVSGCALGPYSIQWTGTKLWGDGGKESGNGTNSGTKYNVPATVPYSLYTFEISSSIDGVFGSPTSCSNTSVETQPGPPIILAADAVQGGALVAWETPVAENGLIVNYGIFVDEEDIPRKTVAGDLHNTTLELESCKTSGLSVKAKNGAGWGSPSEVKDVTSEGNGPPPPKNCSIQVEEGALNVGWQEPDTNCSLGIYNANWTGTKLWGDEEKESGSNTTSGTKLTLLDPVPYSHYTFEISASIDGVFGSSVSCDGTSLETLPGSPVIVAVDSVPGGAVVTWKTPAEENGLIVNYGIFVDDEPDPNKTVNETVHSTNLELDQCKTFGLSVKAENGAGWGPPSEVKDVTVANDVKTLNCEPSGSGNVSLSWTLVDTVCPISSYNVMWVYDSLWSDDTGKGSQDVGKDETSFTVQSLPPYSNVSTQVHVDNNPEYTECITVTSQEKSSPPTTLTQTASNSTSVTITWGLPQYIRGELEGWYLRWTTLDHESIGADTVNEVQRRTYTISELSYSSTYVVYVSAVNGAGSGEQGEINARTEQVTTENPNASTEQNLGLIIGLSTAGGILLIILVAGSIFFFRRRGSSKLPRSAPHMPEVADADSDERYKMQHLGSASQALYYKHGSVDHGTNNELYMGPRPSLHEDKTINEGGQMPGAPPGRRYSQQVSTSLPRLGAYNRRPSQQVNTKLNNYEECNRRPSQPYLTGRPAFSGDPDKPSVKEFGRRPSQQIDVGRPSLKEYDRRPSQQIDLGRLNLSQYGRSPSQQVDLDKPRLGEYGRRPSQQIDIGRPASSEYSRRPSQQLPSGGGSYPSRLSQGEVPRRSSVDLYSRRPSQQAADTDRPGDRMLMKRPSQQFIPSFEGIQEM